VELHRYSRIEEASNITLPRAKAQDRPLPFILNQFRVTGRRRIQSKSSSAARSLAVTASAELPASIRRKRPGSARANSAKESATRW
jgi:hypothetical protein